MVKDLFPLETGAYQNFEEDHDEWYVRTQTKPFKKFDDGWKWAQDHGKRVSQEIPGSA